MTTKKFILWFKELSNKDVGKVGGKNASLGEMYQKLTKRGINVPDGFAVTASAYRFFMQKAGLVKQIKKILSDLDTRDIKNLMQRGEQAREVILKAEFPKELEREIKKGYRQLCAKYKKKDVDVAVRSSATAEDLPDASFAGQQETYLNIRGEEALLEATKKCIASLFTNRAISYRVDKKFDHFKIALSAGIQKMARSDKGSSGVMFTLDTESGFNKVVMINAAYGLGENVVQGKINPDEYYVFKPSLSQGYPAIITKKLGAKHLKMIYTNNPQEPVKNAAVAEKDQVKQAIADKDILELARWAVMIEEHYGRPMDIEWAKDGVDKKLYIVQARPETIHGAQKEAMLEEYNIQKRGKVLAVGKSVGRKIGAGKVKVIKSVKNIDQFERGEVLVTEMTDPDWEPIMKKAAAIVTDSGGRTCHAAIVSRELGIPCIVAAKNATQVLKTGQEVTASCAEGEEGYVYQGKVPFEVKKTSLKGLKRPKTKIMMNVGEPEIAFNCAAIPNDGVGLAREEFIINNYIKIHPLALLKYPRLKDKKAKKEIEKLTAGYKDKAQFFVDKLAEGIGKIGAAFYPNDVIFRMSDFKSNEYACLIGGAEFEPAESNPMIGWRGASRYYAESYKPAFVLECKAFKKVREKMGLKNVKIMIPFCRTPEEGRKVVEIMKQNGLKQGEDGLEIYVMCEIPSNVILAEEFAEIFDGFSIGSNDLTQLTLGLDRDSALVSHVYNERDESVKKLISQVIRIAHEKGRKIGICGQGPSDFPEFAEFLVREGIDSLSITPDTILKTTLNILELEKRLKQEEKAEK